MATNYRFGFTFKNVTFPDKDYTYTCSDSDYTVYANTGSLSFVQLDGTSASLWATFTLTVPLNYKISSVEDSTGSFVSSESCTITDRKLTVKAKNSGSWKLAYSSGTTTYSAYINVYIEEQEQTFSLTQNLENCTSNLTDRTDIKANEVISPIITANDGYYFDAVIGYTMGDTKGNLGRYENNTIAKGDITVTDNVTINASAIELPIYNITQNLENCTSDYTGTTVSGLEEYTITITPIEYYTFNSAATYTYTMGDTSGNLTIASDGTSATLTVTPTADIVITAKTVKAKYRLIEGLSNCTCNIDEDTELIAGETYTITLTSTSADYIFNTAPTIKYSGTTYNFTVSDDKLTATYEFLVSANATISATAIYTKIAINANNGDDNVTNNFVNGDYTIGSTVSMIYSFVDGWFYGNVRFFDGSGTDIQSTLNPTIIVDENLKNVSISFTVPENKVNVYMYSYAGIHVVYSQLKNCTTDFKEGYYPQNKTYTITLTANEGFKFMQEYTPTITVSTRTSEVATFDFSYTDSQAAIEFDADASFLAIDLYSKVSTLTVDASAVGESNIEAEYTFIHAYNPTNDQLYELSGVRFSEFTTTTTGSVASGDYSTTTTETNHDYGQFILKLYKTYIPVSSSKTDTIRLAYYDTQTDAALIDDAIQTLNCGTVKITEINGNNIDYEDTTAHIYLPFIGVFDLPILSVMGHDITLKYICNILDGSCYVTVENETGIFATFTGEIKEEIPYTIEYNEKVVQEYFTNAMIKCSRTPYIYITSHKPLEDIGIFGTSGAEKTDYIKNFKGFNMFANVDLVTSANMLYDEVIAIRNMLQQGVFLDV